MARRAAVFLPLALATLGLVGCEAAQGSAVAAEGEGDFDIVVLPDTQYYTANHPEILRAQTDWIIRARARDNIALVADEGDIVDADEPAQWERAAGSLRRLDGLVPYVLSAGNHDYQRTGSLISRETLMSSYFPVQDFEPYAWFKGTFEMARIENSFAIVPAPGGPWLIMSLEFGPRDVVLAWANTVIKQHASLPVILVTHAYLYSDGTRYDHRKRPDQLWNPHVYLDDRVPGAVNDGEEIWQKLVAGNSNVRFVLCGHDLEDGTGHLTSVRPDGTIVHQILANYQMNNLGGGGYLRIMRFHPNERRVDIRTYSPFTDRYRTDAENQFSLSY
ncbi:MAG TPA: metallophosphoesterase [Polyangia bacterium]